MIKVGILERHPLLAQAWADVINQTADLRVSWIMRTLEEAKKAIEGLATAVNVVLVGIDVPGRDALVSPGLPPVVSLSLRSGPMTAEELRRALMDEAAGKRDTVDQGGAASVLSVREQQVMRLLAQSKTNREIADDLEISVKTVDTHRAHVLKKLGLRNNAELARFAVAHGYVGL